MSRLGGVLLVMVCLLFGSAPAWAQGGGGSTPAPGSLPDPTSSGYCGSFNKTISSDTTYVIQVTTKRVTCRSGTRLMKDFWFRRGRVKRGGPYGYNTYFTLKRWPGWRCYTGAGAGQCKKRGGRRVIYEIPPISDEGTEAPQDDGG